MRLFERVLKRPDRSFFLFGPRGTGKSTWFLKNKEPHTMTFNLLHSETFLKLNRNPSLIEDQTSHLKPGNWVWLDEVQKIPPLLDEVHRLIEEKGLLFALTGSSARKLKRGGANLLAGRATTRTMEGLVFHELQDSWDLNFALQWGCLPLLYKENVNPQEFLSDYLHTYLKEEVREEGLVRKIDPFFRFLEIAGMLNGQKINSSNIAREAHVARATVDTYYQILEDTLIIHYLPGFQPMAKVRESTLPKVFWFDSGVARAAAGLLNEPFDSVWAGFALETYLFHELRVYNQISKKQRPFFYYQTPSKKEIDFIIELKKGRLNTKSEIIPIEIKWSKKWNKEWSKEILTLRNSGKVKVVKAFGVYMGKDHMISDRIEILPVSLFLEKLWNHQIF